MSGINYSPNPSFEGNTTSTTFTACTGTRVLFSAPGTGQFSAKLDADGTAPASATQVIAGLTIGKRYNASFYSYVDLASPTFVMQAQVASWVGPKFKPAGRVWTRQWVAFTASSTSMSFVMTSTETNNLHDFIYIDRIKVTDGEFMGPYFDGDYPFCSWSGTSLNSASSCSAFSTAPTTNDGHGEDAVVINGLCLNTLAWNIVTKTGRYGLPAVRGSNTIFPGQRGQTFVANKPVDASTWTLQLWLIGGAQDGTIPAFGEMKRSFEANWNLLLQNIMSIANALPVAAWQPDGTCRTATLTIPQGVTSDVFVGGRRAEITIPFEILEGVWADHAPISTSGVAGSHWSNDVLTLNGLVGGTAHIEDAIITINGPITNPRVYDSISNTWVQYNGTISSVQTWVVDCGAWTSKVNGVGVLSNTQHFGHPRFLVIDPGNQNRVPAVTLTGSSTGSLTNISISAARRHWTA